tara:strand:- start:177 stop:506 length:330 start_codon:yes stop_codon:yes gene_type:complete
MRSLMRIILALFIIILVTFAIANREMVTVNLWPLPFTSSVPLFIAILGAFAVGLLIGSGLTAWSRQRLKMQARSSERRAERAERTAAEQKASTAPRATVLPPRALPGGN